MLPSLEPDANNAKTQTRQHLKEKIQKYDIAPLIVNPAQKL